MRQRLAIEDVARIEVDEAHRLMEHNQPVVFVDVRERVEYDEKHIRGALPVPLRDFSRSYSRLPRASLIVTY